MASDPEPRPTAGLRRFWRRLQGPWRVAVAEDSMWPAIEPGDWLLVDPTVGRWPRRGSVIVFREPGSELIAIKRVAARPGDTIQDLPVTDPSTGEQVQVTIRLPPDEAWLLGDADARSIDSRRYGPVSLDRLIGRAWFRYAPIRRFGRLR
ncbi:MAG: signal peptidase I [Chloroflexi bacterium]|nr:MAG: signal peptidase I [Chloroflexota bacterium]